MKHRFLTIITVMMLGALTHIYGAESIIVTINDLTYECADSEATVKNMADKSITTCDIPETITHDGVTYRVTSIGERAFSVCNNLTEISIPNTVTHIANYAFSECSGLIEIRIPDSVTSIGTKAFQYCKSLSYVHIGKSVTHIALGAFDYCNGLLQVDIPSIESWLNIDFEKWTSNPLYFAGQLSVNGELVTQLTIPEGTTHINSYCFFNWLTLESVVIPSSLENIGEYVFAGCIWLKKIIFPTLKDYLKQTPSAPQNKITFQNEAEIYIGSEPFSSFSSLEWPEELTVIPDYAFLYDKNIISIKIPNSVTHIGKYAFSECQALTEVWISDSVTSIGEFAFAFCPVLSKVHMGNSVQTIDWFAFYFCSALTEVRIPDSVTSIGMQAFAECPNLTYATIGNSLTTIASKTFAYCSALKNISLGNSISQIDPNAFYKCTNLSDVILPEVLTSIGTYAFAECSSLERVTFGSSIKDIGGGAFSCCDKLSDVVITNLHGWCSVVFDSQYDNPISKTFAFRTPEMDSAIRHLAIDMPGEAISTYAFYGASNLETVRINAKRIGRQCFDKCLNIKHLCLNVEEIDVNAFKQSNDLKAIYSLTETPPVTVDMPFSTTNLPTLYVPVGCADAYRQSEYCWSKFSDIRECDFKDIDSIFSPDHEPIGAVENISANAADFNLTVTDGVISAESDPDTLITIHNLQGACIHAGKGNVSVSVVPGMYIVTAGASSQKIAVR